MKTSPVSVVGLNGVSQIATGESHSCALLQDGTARCWGANWYGQLGDGTTSNRLTPVAVSGLSNVISIAAGGNHTCALLADRTIRCWGYNRGTNVGGGQLGNNTITDSPTPVSVQGLSNVTSISAGKTHTCAILADKTMRCWGDNGQAPASSSFPQYYGVGRLGNGSGVFSMIPVVVSSLTQAASLSAGEQHTCSVLEDGSAKCWGANWEGQLSDGTQMGTGYMGDGRTTPVQVRGQDMNPLQNIVGITTGATHTCFLMQDGIVKCAGYSSWTALGADYGSSRLLTPFDVPGVTSAIQISSRKDHTCAVRSDGKILCWGKNNSGQLGNGATQNVGGSSPVEVLNL
jgi:alpha-tubulin suppressor-like RCC1 family protein